LRGFLEIAAADAQNVEAARDVFVARWLLAKSLDAEHRIPEAEAEYQKVLSGYAWIHERNPADRPFQVVAEARDRLAAYRMAAGDREAAIALYRRNIEMLTAAKGVTEKVMLALDYGLAGDAIAPTDKPRAKASYEQAATLWEGLRDSRQAQYADKPAATRAASQ
jgi:tetratricopeptide (TPR) repeat protein